MEFGFDRVVITIEYSNNKPIHKKRDVIPVLLTLLDGQINDGTGWTDRRTDGQVDG
jgi:hypothetical protein